MNKDAPHDRAIESLGTIISRPVLDRLHHRYCRILVFGTHSDKDTSLILILSDINMPGMSGLDLLPKAKATRPDVPVIMITAYGDADTSVLTHL